MKLTFTYLILILALTSFSQKALEYSFDLPIEASKRKSLQQITADWIQEQNISLKKVEKDTLWASGSIAFNNTVIFKESQTYNRVYREQSNGKIVYHMKAYLAGDKIMVSLSQFKHQPKMKFDNLNFGLITNNQDAPKEITNMTNQVYSKEVWQLIKNLINNYVEEIKGNSVRMASNN